jgi:hypothetical protein
LFNKEFSITIIEEAVLSGAASFYMAADQFIILGEKKAELLSLRLARLKEPDTIIRQLHRLLV